MGDWLIEVLRVLLRDVEEVDGVNFMSRPRCHQDVIAELLASFPTLRTELKEGVEDYSAEQVETTFSNFRVALAIILRRRLSEYHSPLLVHCRFGRDRTGIVIAFL